MNKHRLLPDMTVFSPSHSLRASEFLHRLKLLGVKLARKKYFNYRGFFMVTSVSLVVFYGFTAQAPSVMGPSESYPVIVRLRTGVVLRVAYTVTEDGREWYKIMPDAEILYPERIEGDWYVAAEFVHLFTNIGDVNFKKGEVASSSKRIIVDISEQMLYAYDGEILFMTEPISTGLNLTPTPRGTFTIFKMTPSRFMQGPIPDVSDQIYDLPGVPWNLYFTEDGAVIHGAYWHDHFGKRWSHGCVNLPPQKAKELYFWADIGISVNGKN